MLLTCNTRPGALTVIGRLLLRGFVAVLRAILTTALTWLAVLAGITGFIVVAVLWLTVALYLAIAAFGGLWWLHTRAPHDAHKALAALGIAFGLCVIGGLVRKACRWMAGGPDTAAVRGVQLRDETFEDE